MNDQDLIDSVCYFLINKCVEAEEDSLVFIQYKVSRGDEQLGDWEIIVRKKK